MIIRGPPDSTSTVNAGLNEVCFAESFEIIRLWTRRQSRSVSEEPDSLLSLKTSTVS